MDGEELGGVGGHVLGGGGDVVGLELEDFELGDEGFPELPGGEAAAAPVGDVLFVDGGFIGGVFEDGLDFGEGVEPLEDGAGGVGALEAEVEVFADAGREFGDFGDAGHIVSVQCSVFSVQCSVFSVQCSDGSGPWNAEAGGVFGWRQCRGPGGEGQLVVCE